MEDFKPQAVKGPEGDSQQNFQEQQLMTEAELSPTTGWGKFKQFYSQNKWYFLAIFLGVIIIAGLAAYAFWPRSQEPTEAAKIQLSIDSAETVQAGGEVIYKIKVLNQDPAELVDMHLELVYDEGINYVSSSPKSDNLSGSSFVVPDLSNGQNAVVIVKALAQGNVNDEKKLTARLRYKFNNFSSPFTAEAEHILKLVAADVVLDLTGPDQVNNNEDVKYDLFYRNSSSKDIENTRIQLSYPEGFKFSSGEPTPSLGQNIWNLGMLKANQSGKISFTGKFQSSPVGQENIFKAELLALDENSDYFTQSSTSFKTVIASKPLSAEARMTNSGGVVSPGANVSVEIKFQNNTQIANTGLQLVAQIESNNVIAGSIKAEGGYVQDQTITWNGSSNSALETLAPKQSGTVKFTFQVSEQIKDSDGSSVSIVIKSKIKSNENSSFISGSDLDIKITSQANMEGSVSHVSGELPPKVGSSTTYKLKLALTNGTNDYQDGLLVGYVPVGVSIDLASIPSAEKNLVKFDSSTGKLTWNVGTLKACSGSSAPARTLEFNVSTVPSSSQLGKSIILFKTANFTAKEDFTGKSVNLTIDKIETSELPGGSSSGRVVN